MKILVIDIETSPLIAPVWGLWENNVSYKHIQREGQILCYAAKWLGEKKVFFDSVHHSNERAMLKSAHALLSEADAVISFNGVNFDVKHLNAHFLLHKIKPPEPFKNIDLLKVAKGRFKFPSNKLDYIAKRLGIGQKTEHEGMELWLKCMAGNKTAWATMKRYNINDVILTETVYYKLLPWIQNHPNVNLFSDIDCCSNCGSGSLQSRGRAITSVGSYQRYQCLSCGAWNRGTRTIHKRVKIRSEV